MKKILFVLIIMLGWSGAYAQTDRSKAPAPGPAREIKLGEYQTFTLKNGLKVFVVENHKLPRVQFSLQLRNNPILEGDKAGYVSLAGDLIGTGTKTRTKAQLDEAVDFIGATLNTSASGVFASSLTKHTDKLLDLMTDVLYNPSFASEELDKLKTQTLSTLAANKESPGTIASNVQHVLVYGKDHPYGELTTEKTVESVSLDDCKKYYNTYFKPGNAYLAIVGDIDLKNAKKLAKKYFEKWPAGDAPNPTYTTPRQPEKTFVALVDRPTSVQSVISIGYPVELRPGDPDAIKADVLNQILGGGFSSRLMQNLREDKAFTYGARSSLEDDPLVGAFNASASVRNEVTDSSVYEFIYEMKRIREAPVTDDELAAAKAYISGAFGRALERPQTVANFAINTAKYNLPANYYANYVKNIAATTKEDVTSAAAKFMRPDHAYIIVVGKGSEVADKLKKFGEVKYYDIYGEHYTPKAGAGLPPGLTAEKVVGKYLEAIGGKDKLQKVKSAKLVYKASAMGMELIRTDLKKLPAKSIIEVVAGGNTFQKLVSDGKNLSLMVGGQKPPLDSKIQEMQIFDGSLFKELLYPSMNVKVALQGIQQVEGKDAYVVEYTLPQGAIITEFYDSGTGLKVQTVQTVETPQGEMVITRKYDAYKEVEGVKFPHMITQSQGPMNIAFEVTSLEVNPALEDKLFEVEK